MKFPYITTACCAKNNVVSMDHMAGDIGTQHPVVNRMCVNCGAHWYGDDGANVVQIPRKTWDHWMAQPEQVSA